VATLYGFPADLDGRGQAVGVIALGGGYLTSDLRRYFRALHLPMPRIRAKSIDGVRNAPRGETAQFDGEVTGDVQTVGAIAPRARITVYFAPNTPRGFFEAVAAAVHDGRQRNTVISISWGQAEVHWHRSMVLAFNQVLLEAAVLGITVCCSSGDQGSFADAHDRKPHVNFPGSSPYVLSCGGTTLVGARTRIRSERVWHNQTGASGGGVSAIFPPPHWQGGFRVPRNPGGYRGRGVPDVASNADPLTGYRVFVHGQWHVGAGTSAASPLWAGLIARINQRCGTAIGLPTPYLYRHFTELARTGAVVPVTRGSNGLYRARRGWSCCTGLGTPRGARLARALAKHHQRSER
jgi:kumamolisin